MNYTQILNILSLVIPAIIAGTKKVIKGNEKYLIAIAVYFALKKFSEASAVSEVQQKIQEVGRYNNNALAQLYRQAVNPSGYKWLMELDGTNEEMLFKLAAETYNYQGVATAYKALYETDLTEDLRKELSTSDFQQFMQILNRI